LLFFQIRFSERCFISQKRMQRKSFHFDSPNKITKNFLWNFFTQNVAQNLNQAYKDKAVFSKSHLFA